MRKVIVTTFVSIDGVMQAPGGPDEDTSGGFQFGGWTVPFWDEATTKITDEIYKAPYDLLLGRRTYDIFASYWPNVEKDPAKPGYDEGNAKIGNEFDACTKYVATSSPQTLGWQHSQWLGQNVVQEIRNLKKQDGPALLVPGSSQLVPTLVQHRLADELRLLVFPLVLGRGKRLFGDQGQPTAFKVTQSVTSPNGVTSVTYACAGDVQTGSFEEPPKKEATSPYTQK
jgi:dihydrofolate reductase